MSGFDADWLATREPFDVDARSARLVGEVAAHWSDAEVIEVVDLGTGTGANVRYLAPRIDGRQRWTVVDHDARLLEALAPRLAGWAEQRGYRFRLRGPDVTVTGAGFEAEVRPCELDLTRELDRVVREGVHLVTTAALLDLVSERWLAHLARACQAAGAAVLFALTYDGETTWSPEDPDDTRVRDAVNRHQGLDKGFGPGLGPGAAGCATTLYRAAGYRVAEAKSDWRIGPEAGAMQRVLLDGWRIAAAEIEPDRAGAFAGWAARRARAIAQGVSSLRVGHVDIAGRPG
jgi:SAM-dependent methyltransferase